MGWVYFPGGYKQMRALAGLPSASVDLVFTGKMLKDLSVTSIISQTAPTSKRGKKSVAKVVIGVGFKTQGSARTAERVKYGGGKFGRPFVFYTDEEVNFLQAYLEVLMLDAIGLAPRDARGRFVKLSI